MAEYSDSNHLAEVYGYYDEQPAFRFIQSGDAIADGQRNADALPNMVLTRKPAGKWDKDRLAQGSQCMIPESRLGQVQKASKLMGTPVKNKQDENLGKVENLLVDLPAGVSWRSLFPPADSLDRRRTKRRSTHRTAIQRGSGCPPA